MRITKNQIKTLKELVEKLEQDQKREKIRITSRRKSQLRGKTINKRIQKRKKPITTRRPAKKRSSIR